MALRFSFYNTRSKKKELFVPQNDGSVTMYACGPTVYDFVHIGNFRTYLFEDTLRRALSYSGYSVTFASNITDVGHLTNDGDLGEDKIEIGARQRDIEPLTIARTYEEHYWKDSARLNILPPDKVLRATESIPPQLDLISELLNKGFAYIANQAIYFDVSKYPDYGSLTGQELSQKRLAAREGVVADSDKRNPSDFALWFFTVGRHSGHILHWPSPWGDGFPGWHIECSAISRELLGQPFDIHAGAEDLIPVHHTNEIAQSEAAYAVPLAHYWLHGSFLKVDGQRMGKSLGNGYTLDDLVTNGEDPLAFRYFTYIAHYRQTLNFTWESLGAASHAYLKLVDVLFELKARGTDGHGNTEAYDTRFANAIADDLNMPAALTVVWALSRDENISPIARYQTITANYDRVLALSLARKVALRAEIPDEIRALAEERHALRLAKRWEDADEARDKLEKLGYEVRDTEHGPVILKM
ncbi:MAG: cysteine--tRNA ligase [Candidatus Vogelbacteria bacterium]|nr:cysteine--tRNA ligase [Candidatus Vogelbacteria bacterium]